MATSIDPTRLSRRTDWNDEDPNEAPPPNAGAVDRGVREASYDRHSAWVAAGRGQDPSASCDTVLSPALFRQQPGDVHSVDLHDVQQNQFGDCFLMAPLAALARTPEGRALIQSAVVENADGSYTVTLHKPEKHWFRTNTFSEVQVTVRGPFACGHAQARKDGAVSEIWPLVFEAAYATFLNGYQKMNSGDPALAIEALTGNKADRLAIGALFHRYGAQDLKGDLAAGKIVIFETNARVEPVACRAPGSGPSPGEYNLYGAHAYVAIGTEERNGKQYLLLQNPWNERHPDPIPFDRLSELFRAVDIGAVR